MKANIEVVRFSTADIVVTSGGVCANPALPPALGGNKAVICGNEVA